MLLLIEVTRFKSDVLNPYRTHAEAVSRLPGFQQKAETPAQEAPEKEAPQAEEKHEGEGKHDCKHHHHETAALQAKLEAEEKKNADLKNQLLRTAAEYDNYRKRTAKEKESLWTDVKADTAAHRFGGKCMVIGGIAMIVTSPFQNVWIFLALVIVPCILPVVYSYMFYRKTMG